MTQKVALISVSDKAGIVEFASNLIKLGYKILSTGGTYKLLQDNQIKVTEVASHIGFPEIMDGRVKTLNPKIHGGILAVRDNPEHVAQASQHGIDFIDLVCVNLYPFEATINNPTHTLTDAIENIDIGGPAMIRASAKNHQDVIIVTDPTDYSNIVETLGNKTNNIEFRRNLAIKAFAHTAYYDSVISNYLANLTGNQFIKQLTIPLTKVQDLRYGENSHQAAAFYKDAGNIQGLLASFQQLQGKELSYNNLSDADSAWECVKQFDQAACVIVKHANPCGVAYADNLVSAYNKAFSCDPISSFGGIIAFNQQVTAAVATLVAAKFIEVVIAPSYSPEALAIFTTKANVRVLQIDLVPASNNLDYKRIGGGMLVQTNENKLLDCTQLTTVSRKQLDTNSLADLSLAWAVARMVKSNAIVLVKDGQTIGIGAGQMSRIDSSKIAINKAREFGFDVTGSVCASDAFFPFRDNVDLLADNGVEAIIQPGGSIKDSDVFAASDEKNIAMVTTGYRVFRH